MPIGITSACCHTVWEKSYKMASLVKLCERSELDFIKYFLAFLYLFFKLVLGQSPNEKPQKMAIFLVKSHTVQLPAWVDRCVCFTDI